MSRRLQSLEALVAAADQRPVALAHLARLFQAEGHVDRALNLCLRALALAPSDAWVTSLVAHCLSASVPRWHFTLVRDSVRSRAYETAIERAITPGCRVLEIGAGTGLLAMMAARAGAAEVITCEVNPVVAHLARRIIDANGYAERVRLVPRHSTELEVERDLGGPADVLVTEIFSNDLVSEGALPALEDAARRLLKPDARIIPARGRVIVALGDDGRAGEHAMGTVEGLDLSAFNLVRPPSYDLLVGTEHLRLQSNPVTLFEFDFESGGPFPAAAASAELAALGGPVNGVVQWLALDLDERATYEARPFVGTKSCWAAVFHPLPRARNLSAGETVHVHGRHTRRVLKIWAAEAGTDVSSITPRSPR